MIRDLFVVNRDKKKRFTTKRSRIVFLFFVRSDSDSVVYKDFLLYVVAAVALYQEHIYYIYIRHEPGSKNTYCL